MSPKELKVKYHLSNAKLATLLHRDQRTIERYLASNRYPESIAATCYLLDQYLAVHNSYPPYVWGNLIPNP